jgi:anti-sigma regulatory factor (Ser/Thr protein kinase)
MVSEATGLYSHKPALVLLLVELFNNALDHGLLELQSSLKDEPEGYIGYYAEREKRLKSYTDGQISIQITHQLKSCGGQLLFHVQDSGAGFDFEKVTESTSEEKHGRGLSLVRQLSDSMSFSDDGRCIDVVYVYTND